MAEEIEKRGGKPLDPLEYKRIYLDRLWARIRHRVEALKAGQLAPDEWMVPGGRAMLEALRARQRALLPGFAAPTSRTCSTRRPRSSSRPILPASTARGTTTRASPRRSSSSASSPRTHLSGPEFVAFGDGFVEIEDSKHVGGIAVGVASDEANRSGVDAWKRNRLIEAGADVIVPDFREHEALIAYLFHE